MSGAHRGSLALLFAALMLGVLAVGSFLLLRSDRQGTTWDYFRAQHDELRVFKTVRPCDEMESADVEETADRIEVTLHVDLGGLCGDLAEDKFATVALSGPIRDRPVYDGACLDEGGTDAECLRSGPDQRMRTLVPLSVRHSVDRSGTLKRPE